jgi:hypothetical protein
MTTKQPDPLQPAPHRAAKPAVILRETDGRTQLVGYLGWRTILTRLANRP